MTGEFQARFEERYQIRSLMAALDVVESFLDSEDGKRGVTEISRMTNLRKERVHRILNTLMLRGYIEQDDQTRHYALGARFLSVGEKYRAQFDLIKISEPDLRDLAESTGDSAHLFVLSGFQAVCIDVHQGDHLLQAASQVGYILPLHAGSCPKILFTSLAEDERARLLDRMELTPYTPNTITDRAELEKVLEEIQELGYYVEEEQYERGVCAVGAPICDHTGAIVAAISLVIPRVRYEQESRTRLVDLVLKTAGRISKKLGYRGP